MSRCPVIDGGLPAGTSSRSSRAAARMGSPSKTPPGSLIYANDAAARMSGFASGQDMQRASTEEIVGRFEILDEDGRPLPIDELPGRRAFTGEREPEAVVRFRKRSGGGDRWALVRATPLFDTRGEVRHVRQRLRGHHGGPGATASADVPRRCDPGAQPFAELGSDHPARRSARGSRPGGLVLRRCPRSRRVAVTDRPGTRRSGQGRVGARVAATIPQ